MSFLFRKLVIRLCVFLFIVGAITFLTLLFLTSLYRTIPSNIPFLSSVPIYRNKWEYTPPSHLTHPNPLFKAAFITFAKNDRESLSDVRATIRQIEDMFNKDYHYPYIIFCYQALSTEYKELVSSLTQSDVVFEKVSDADYGYTNTTDKFRAELARKYLRNTQDNTLEFRFKSRLMAGTIFNHPRLSELDYFWRFEPGTEYMCPIDFDPFQYMYDHGKQVSFSIATYENHETIPTLFKSVSKFKQQNPQFKYMSADQGDNSIMSNMLNNGKYNRCFFWNSFQIASTRFFKSPEYTAYFKFLDAQEGIFYERWSDAVIQSLAAALFLDKDQLHFWEDIGYRHRFFYSHCPNNNSIWERCSCRPEQNFDNDSQSCLANFQQ